MSYSSWGRAWLLAWLDAWGMTEDDLPKEPITGGRRQRQVIIAPAYVPTPKRWDIEADDALLLLGAI